MWTSLRIKYARGTQSSGGPHNFVSFISLGLVKKRKTKNQKMIPVLNFPENLWLRLPGLCAGPLLWAGF